MECLYEIPEVEKRDENGELLPDHEHLPFFRPVKQQPPVREHPPEPTPIALPTEEVPVIPEVPVKAASGEICEEHHVPEQPDRQEAEEGEIVDSPEIAKGRITLPSLEDDSDSERTISDVPRVPSLPVLPTGAAPVVSDSAELSQTQAPLPPPSPIEQKAQTSHEIEPDVVMDPGPSVMPEIRFGSSENDKAVSAVTGKRPVAALGSGYTHEEVLCCYSMGIAKKQRTVVPTEVQCDREEEDRPLCIPFLTP